MRGNPFTRAPLCAAVVFGGHPPARQLPPRAGHRHAPSAKLLHGAPPPPSHAPAFRIAKTRTLEASSPPALNSRSLNIHNSESPARSHASRNATQGFSQELSVLLLQASDPSFDLTTSRLPPTRANTLFWRGTVRHDVTPNVRLEARPPHLESAPRRPPTHEPSRRQCFLSRFSPRPLTPLRARALIQVFEAFRDKPGFVLEEGGQRDGGRNYELYPLSYSNSTFCLAPPGARLWTCGFLA